MIPIPIATSTDAEIEQFVRTAFQKIQDGLLEVAKSGTGIVVFAARDSWGEVFVSTSPEVVEALHAGITEH
jgi:hypothetical protein